MVNYMGIDDNKRKAQKEGSECRKWSDMNHSILVKIFKKIWDRQLLDDVSLVCRSWQIACWDILFWKYDNLDFQSFNFVEKLGPSPMEYSKMERRGMKLIKSTIEGDTAYGTPLEGWTQSLNSLFFPDDFHVSDRILLYIAERTPKVSFIFLNSSKKITGRGFSRAIAHWKQVKFILLGPIDGGCHVDIIAEMGKNWKMLEHLHIHIDNFVVDQDNSIAIAKNFPGLLSLGLWHCFIYKSGIKSIVSHCRELNFVKIEACMLMDEKNGSRKKARLEDFKEWSTMKVNFRVTN